MAVDIDHSGKATLVTGAGAGIGKEIALWMARAGSDVAIIDRRKEYADSTLEDLQKMDIKAYAITGDARDDENLKSMVREATDLMGGLDFAINNIGMLGPRGSAGWLDISTEQIRDVIEQNLVLTAVACHTQAQIMAEISASKSANGKTDKMDKTAVSNSDNGVIINVSSGETSRPAVGLSGYGAAKAGINHLTQTLAVELGSYGIRVNAIAPGTTRTEQIQAAFSDEQYQAFIEATPLKRETHIDELGRLVVFLTSDLARCITGQLILADAGAHLSRSRPVFDIKSD